MDVTYRLYDYGRPRELHLDDAVAVARAEAYPDQLMQHVEMAATQMLVDGPQFTLVQSRGDALQGRLRWVLPLEASARSGDDVAEPGECLLLEPGEELVRRWPDADRRYGLTFIASAIAPIGPASLPSSGTPNIVLVRRKRDEPIEAIKRRLVAILPSRCGWRS